MPTSTVSSTAATEAWGLVWRIFSADKPRRMVTLNELGLAPMQAMALTSLQPGEPPRYCAANACNSSPARAGTGERAVTRVRTRPRHERTMGGAHAERRPSCVRVRRPP